MTMKTMIITEELLRDLLGKAFEAGWYGTKELKESAVEDLVTEAMNSVEKSQKQSKPEIKWDDPLWYAPSRPMGMSQATSDSRYFTPSPWQYFGPEDVIRISER